MPLSIKKLKNVDFPDELSTEDIISDITNSDPNDILFQKYTELTGKSSTEQGNENGMEFKSLCEKIDEINRINELYDQTEKSLQVLKKEKAAILNS